jgi:hypothetical protein
MGHPPARAPFTGVNTGFPTEPRNSLTVGCGESCFREMLCFPAVTLPGVECHPNPMRSMDPILTFTDNAR